MHLQNNLQSEVDKADYCDKCVGDYVCQALFGSAIE